MERHYASLRLDDADKEVMRSAIRTRVSAMARAADQAVAANRNELARLKQEERKLLAGHYADQISEDLSADEQVRIRRERVAATTLIDRHSVQHDAICQALDVALALTERIDDAYRAAQPTERRLLNQAFFERAEIWSEDVVESVLAEPFRQLHDPTLRAKLLNAAPDWNLGRTSTRKSLSGADSPVGASAAFPKSLVAPRRW